MHCVTPFLRQANNLLVFYFDEPQSYQTVLGALECIGKRARGARTNQQHLRLRTRAEPDPISAAGQILSWRRLVQFEKRHTFGYVTFNRVILVALWKL